MAWQDCKKRGKHGICITAKQPGHEIYINKVWKKKIIRVWFLKTTQGTN